VIPAIQISLTTESAALLARSQAWPRALMTNLRTTLDLENQLTAGHIAATRLSRRGPETLGVVTNRLRPSVRPTVAVVQGDALYSAIGSNVVYMAPHEFGFTGTVQVKEHRARHHALDVFNVRGSLVHGWQLANLRKGNRPSRVAEGFVTVRAHPMQMNIKERAPLRRGIGDRVPHYRTALSATVVATFAGSN
jgi:hypothetical protein